MTQEKIAEYFDALTVSANELAQDADMSMTDALIEVLENIIGAMSNMSWANLPLK